MNAVASARFSPRKPGSTFFHCRDTRWLEKRGIVLGACCFPLPACSVPVPCRDFCGQSKAIASDLSTHMLTNGSWNEMKHSIYFLPVFAVILL